MSDVLPPTAGMIPYFLMYRSAFHRPRLPAHPFIFWASMRTDEGGARWLFYPAWLWIALETEMEQNHKGQKEPTKKKTREVFRMYHPGEWGAEFETKWNSLGKRRTDGRGGGKQKAQRWVDDTSVALTPALFYVISCHLNISGYFVFVLSELRSRLASESRILSLHLIIIQVHLH